MKKKYEPLQLEILKFENTDIVTESSYGDYKDGTGDHGDDMFS